MNEELYDFCWDFAKENKESSVKGKPVVIGLFDKICDIRKIDTDDIALSREIIECLSDAVLYT